MKKNYIQFSFNPLFAVMKKKGISVNRLCQMTNLHHSTIENLRYGLAKTDTICTIMCTLNLKQKEMFKLLYYSKDLNENVIDIDN